MTWDDAIKEIQALHGSKRKDYGSDADPWANVRVSELYGVPAWLHASMLVDHKSRRIQTFAEKGKLEHEGVRDSLIDRCVYALAALVLFDENVEGDGSSSSIGKAAPKEQTERGPRRSGASSGPISPSTYCPDCNALHKQRCDFCEHCTNEWHDAAS